MKTILRRKDKTSIYIPSSRRHHVSFVVKMKAIEFTVGCTLLVIGLFITTITL